MPSAEDLIFLNENFGFSLMSKIQLWSYTAMKFLMSILMTYLVNTGVFIAELYKKAHLKINSPNCVKVYTHTVEEGFTIDSKEVSTLFCTYPLPRKKDVGRLLNIRTHV